VYWSADAPPAAGMCALPPTCSQFSRASESYGYNEAGGRVLRSALVDLRGGRTARWSWRGVARAGSEIKDKVRRQCRGVEMCSTVQEVKCEKDVVSRRGARQERA
jgi:hypothetical protein